MNSLRINIVALLVWLTVFFNIERLDFAGDATINLESIVYVVAVAVALFPLLPFFQRRPLIVSVGAALALLIAALLAEPSPDLGGFHTYITLVEIMMIAVLAVLAYRVGASLEEFRRAVEIVTLKDKTARLHTMYNAQPMVQTEMASSRRNRLPLSLLVFQADASSVNMMIHRFVQELQRAMMQRYVLAMTARVLSRHLRRTDLIIEDDTPGRLVLVAPETPGENALVLGQRLTHLVKERLGITASYGVATFPEQALTFDELLSVAEKQLHEQAATDEAQEQPEQALALGQSGPGRQSATTD